MNSVKKLEYSNGDITIVWTPSLCSHAGNCVKNLPDVYKPKERPWVQIEHGTTEQVVNQMKTCPSGALSYYFNDERVEDLPEKKRYELKTKEGTAFLEYIRAGTKIFLTHTEVPTSLEGKGIGSKLVHFALEDVKKMNKALIPLCPFVAGYIKKNPSYKDLVFKNIHIAND
jgi:predicted GNAT family acetyltransferase